MLSIPCIFPTQIPCTPDTLPVLCTMTQDLQVQTSVCLYLGPKVPHISRLSEGQVIAFPFGILCPVLFREPRAVVVT